ncbi:uncharacterized protein TNCV_1128401 [Trichonephila clavipes]|nr:uncharacterized protein TNCV_1128401 [Trichonephila clavipes]
MLGKKRKLYAKQLNVRYWGSCVTKTRSLDLTPCDLRLWGFLRSLVYLGGVATFNDLNSIMLYVRSLATDQLRSAVEHTVHRLEILHVNVGGHFQHLSLHRPVHDCDNCSSCAISS